MQKIKFLLRRIVELDYKRMFRTIKELHEKSGKSYAFLFFDIIRCGVLYGAGYNDYKLCEFYLLTKKQRETYVTRGINNRLVQMLNKPEFYHFIENKIEFNQLFKDFIHRGWIDMTKASLEDFTAFMEDQEVIISKPVDLYCGIGVEKLKKSDFPSVEALYDHIKQSGNPLVEEFIVQHKDISAIYPHSVNTYRIVTVLQDETPHVVYAFIRIGNGGKFVDNINNGGMAAPVDVETGVITHPGYDKDKRCFDVHPETNCPIVGYKLPYWQESIKMCLDAAKVLPQVGYVGWDIAVSEDGPQLIEGNQFPGHDILQMPPHVPDHIGMLPEFRKYVKGI